MQDRPAPGANRPPRKNRPGVGRTLHPNTDRVIEAKPAACPKCRAAFLGRGADPAADLRTHRIVPIKRDMTQVRLFGGRCAWCGERVTAEAPAGLEQGSPFGHSTVAIVVYLHHAHAIGVVDWRR